MVMLSMLNFDWNDGKMKNARESEKKNTRRINKFPVIAFVANVSSVALEYFSTINFNKHFSIKYRKADIFMSCQRHGRFSSHFLFYSVWKKSRKSFEFWKCTSQRNSLYGSFTTNSRDFLLMNYFRLFFSFLKQN